MQRDTPGPLAQRRAAEVEGGKEGFAGTSAVP